VTKRNTLLALALFGCCAMTTCATEMVGVEGSDTQYPTPVVRKIGGKDTKLVLTGTAMRKKYLFSVYAIAGYLQEGVRVRSGEELAAADCAKQMHLVMERNVDGKDMAEAFHAAIRMNYAAPAFDNELRGLMEYMKANPVRKGDHVFLTHIPGRGLHVVVVGKAEMMIENVAFARAVWEIYLGRNNLGDAIKKGLTARLG
jgi:hypothetical protein